MCDAFCEVRCTRVLSIIEIIKKKIILDVEFVYRVVSHLVEWKNIKNVYFILNNIFEVLDKRSWKKKKADESMWDLKNLLW